MRYQPLPVGVENFEDFYTDDYYYIDKTLFIRELLDQKAKVNLFTRPRRFGKTLTLSVLRYFFEDSYDFRGNKENHRHLFEGWKIMDEGERYLRHMGQYPVISLSLKSGKQAEFESCMCGIRNVIVDEFRRHSYILRDDCLLPNDKEDYLKYMSGTRDYMEYKDSLKFLSYCLKSWHGKPVIVLIDEYDVPLEGSFVYHFYDQMVDFIRGLFESTLKTNESLYFSVITGCLRISKESIFTGLNNLDINSILSTHYGEYFGFTEEDVEKLCRDYDMPQKYPEIKEWYNGYLFGNSNVYNPWSTIKYVKDHLANMQAYPIAYWVNTSGNAIVKDLIVHADESAKQVIEDLIAGKTITIPVHEDVTYGEIYDSQDNLWNFLFFTGYFRKVEELFEEGQDKRYLTVRLVNREIRYLFREKVLSWFADKIKASDRTILFQAFVNGDTDILTKELNALLHQTISFHDYYENFYHGFLAGILTGMGGYVTKSNREGGSGRSDIFIKPLSRRDTAFVVELKVADSITTLDKAAKDAITQIVDRNYEQELYDDGYIQTRRYGIAFFHKDCLAVEG